MDKKQKRIPIMEKLPLRITGLIISLLVVVATNTELRAQRESTSQKLVSNKEVIIGNQGKMVSLAHWLTMIEQNFQVTFLFKDEVVQHKWVNTDKIRLGDDTGQELWDILDRLELIYRRVDEQTYVLLRKENHPQKVAMQEQVSGTVTDGQSGETLPGVNIKVKGTTTGTATDANGQYELSVESLQDTLVFSFVGYQTQQVPISGRTTINIKMQSQAITGQELVVTALGIERSEKTLTYSTQQVNTENITEAKELNVVNSLKGKVAGINISQGGSGVGAPTRVTLRGNRSISGDSQPLYVIDGVPSLGDPQNIEPDNIASINVLKGANAAALYGSEAQNGVIVIETKKGHAGKVNVSLNNTFMLKQAQEDIPYQDAYGQGVGGAYKKDAMSSWGPKMEGQSVEHWSLDPSMVGKMYAFNPQPDNINDFFQSGFSLSNNLQASIGSEKAQGLLSVTSTEGQGVLPNNELQRRNVLLRVNGNLSDRFSWDGKISYIQQNVDNPLPQSDSNFNPMQQILLMPRNIRTQDASNFEFLGPEGVKQQNFWAPGRASTAENPYWVSNRNTINTELGRVIGMVSLKYDFMDNLSLRVRGSYDRKNKTYEKKDHNNTFVRAPQGRYTVNKDFDSEFNGDFLLSYQKELNADWSIDGNMGGNIKKQLINQSFDANTGPALLIPNLFSLSNTNFPQTSFNPGAEINIQSLYAFAKVGWREAIYLDLTGRNDWSSTLPAGSRSYFYPSVGLSMVLSDLVQFPSIFSFAKLRASWAKVGSSAPPNMLSRSTNFSAGGTNGFLRLGNVLPNKDLKPEETTSFESGFNVRFLDERLALDLTYFNTNTKNQLFTIALPVGSGASSFFTNGGNIQNRGIEVILNSTPIRSSKIKWNLDLNFSRLRNTVESISDERPKVVLSTPGNQYFSDFVIKQGGEFGAMYTTSFTRDDNGNVIVGSNGVPQINNARDYNIGTYTPDWTAGITSTISYKNLSLSIVIDHRQGGVVGSFTRANLAFNGLTKETLQGRDGGLIFGDNFFSDYSAVTEGGQPNNIPVDAETFWQSVGNVSVPVGEAFAYDATNTRLREVIISYSLPSSTVNSIGFRNIKISLVGRNLLFISRATTGLDPDILVGTQTSSEGFSSFPPPTMRSFGMNLKIDF